MKQIYFALIVLLSCANVSMAQQAKSLKFNDKGKFKILQLADIHYIPNDIKAANALVGIDSMLMMEKPDLVVFTGDNVTGKPSQQGYHEVLDIVAKRNIPFLAVFGNHDDEMSITRAELLELVQSYPQNLTTTAPGVHGYGNGYITINNRHGKPERIIYTFDSNAYSQNPAVHGFDHIRADQVQWYRETSAHLKAQYGDSLALPALAYFHIPLPEYNQAAAEETAPLRGSRLEKACAPPLNSGLFASFLEMGDVQATFVGHDHDCDYAVMWYGIMLAYGRSSGDGTTYGNLKPHGCRVVELTEGDRKFRTWNRLRDGRIIDVLQYPDDLTRKK
ncbi:MAG: metallophosphoesterase family protein [Bacteroidales bacterium]|jgi:hypothetical protein|nr:metallophosphoesterase family protein [Bacteroidales bacterium]